MIDLDSPPPCPMCGAPTTVHEYRDGDDHGWWWSCPAAACGAEDNNITDERPTPRNHPATAALAAEIEILRERLHDADSRANRRPVSTIRRTA